LQEDYLNIGEVKAFESPVLLTCYGLGSCIGLYLFDSLNKRGGGAHIMLGEEEKNETGAKQNLAYAKQAIDELLKILYNFSATPTWIRAKIIGGAKVIKSEAFNVGSANIEVVKTYLIKKGVYIASMDVGGEWVRTGKFETNTGKLLVTATHNTSNERKMYYL